MTITVNIPDEFAALLAPEGQNPSPKALEDMAVEAYRAHRLTEHQLATLPGIGRYDLDGFLKARGVWPEYGTEDYRREHALADQLRQKRHAQE